MEKLNLIHECQYTHSVHFKQFFDSFWLIKGMRLTSKMGKLAMKKLNFIQKKNIALYYIQSSEIPETIDEI